MAMPKDPVMLLSYVNTQLRDNYPSLDELCRALGESREEIEKTALADADVSRFLGDTPVKKVIIVPKRLVNIVAPAPKA